MARQPRKSPPSSKPSGRATPKARKADVDIAKLSLTDAIKAVATGHARTPGQAAEPPPTSLTQAMKDVASRRRNPPTTRAGRKGIVIYVDQEVAMSIRRLATELNT